MLALRLNRKGKRMRGNAIRGVAVTAAVLLSLGSATAANAAGPLGGPAGPLRTPAADQYPNVLAEAGYSKQAIDARIDAAWQQLFHGKPGVNADRGDGQTLYYELGSDMAYVEDIANRDVRSEGIGYAMMIAVQLGHRSEFDKLWTFAKRKMQLTSGQTKYFFAWHTDTSGKVLSTGIAPDGDQWIAAALSFAGARWSGGTGIANYRKEAEQILHAMWHQSDTGGVDMFDRSRYLPRFSPPGAVNFTDPSYCLPAFYKIFATVDASDKALWDKAYTASIKLLQQAANPKTGLVPDYANFDGSPYLGAGENANDESYTHNFQEDAWRAIANVNVDAAWFGTQAWHTRYSNTLEQFFDGLGLTTYPSRYHLDGTPLKGGQNTYEPAHAQGLVAMNATSAISATYKARLDFARDLWNTAVPTGYARYYDGLLYMLGLLYTSGQFRIWQ